MFFYFLVCRNFDKVAWCSDTYFEDITPVYTSVVSKVERSVRADLTRSTRGRYICCRLDLNVKSGHYRHCRGAIFEALESTSRGYANRETNSCFGQCISIYPKRSHSQTVTNRVSVRLPLTVSDSCPLFSSRSLVYL